MVEPPFFAAVLIESTSQIFQLNLQSESNLSRLCLTKNGCCTSMKMLNVKLFSDCEFNEDKRVISKRFNLHVASYDPVPSKVCGKFVTQILGWFDFIQFIFIPIRNFH